MDNNRGVFGHGQEVGVLREDIKVAL